DDLAETAAGLRFTARSGEPVMAHDAGALVEGEAGAVSTALAEAAELPAALRLGFLDEGADYRPAVAEARGPLATQRREVGLEIPAVMGEAEAAARARAIHADAHLMRETAQFSLPPSLLALEPGDVVYLDAGDGGRRWRVTEIMDGPARRIEAARVSASIYETPLGASSFRPPAPGAVYGPPVWALMDLPLLAEETPRPAVGAALFAAYADPWPGAVALYRAGASPVFVTAARQPALMGRLVDAHWPSAVSGRWLDHSIRLRLSSGALSSKSEAEVLAGANLLAIETGAGFELMQFREARLDEDGAWTLSWHLRGQLGTEDQALLGAPAGARIVLIERTAVEALYPLDLRGAALAWQAGPDRDFPDTENFSHADVALTARALRPLAPVHLKAAPEAGGRRLSFIRRTRIGGDNWESEVPLGEAAERYRLRIYDGAALLREVELAAPDYFYTDAEILADFGSGGLGGASDPAFEVAQISDGVGAGLAARRAL
ncbi:MAG: phage tail protein, partial [Amphiplicatus sp.]